jgi:ribosomal protein S12 methylthiotransferase accessory factor
VGDLRIGELKALLALAIGDEQAIRDGCEWVRNFEQIEPWRRLVYRCIETLLELGGPDRHRAALEDLYGSATVVSAEAMLRRQQKFFGIEAPGLALEGCDLHQRLLAAYAKLKH